MLSTAQPETRGAPEARSADVVLRDAIENLRRLAPKKLKELRDVCTEDLARLDNAAAGAVVADEFFRPLRLACDAASSPKVVSTALDAIQKLMVNGSLTGKGNDPFKEGKDRCLIDSVIESVCRCAEQGDESVQMHMIRALETAVTSQTCEVHGDSLMLAVDTCFKINRDSKISSNQRTAHNSLTQMLNVVTQRMELSSADMSRRTPATPFDEATVSPPRNHQAAKLAASELALLPPRQVLNDWMSTYVTQLVDKVVLQDAKKSGSKDAIVNASPDLGPPGKFGWCVVCRKAAQHYCVDTQDPVCGKECKFRNLERINLVQQHFGSHREDLEIAERMAQAEASDNQDTVSETPAASATEESTRTPVPTMTSDADTFLAGSGGEESTLASGSTSEQAETRSLAKLNPYHRDALLVFEHLCKTSMKDLPPGQADARVVRSKRTSLELILSMLQHAGPVFRSSEPFITVLKRHLCISLIKNSVSHLPKIFGHSLHIFVVLITNFKEHLRTEIGVFIEQIFLRILESGNSTYNHKSRVLQVFYKLCTDASTALELFLNFDCDVDEKNIFERMVDCLSKIAQGKYTSIEHANLIQPHQELELKGVALEALVKLMGSIVDWARQMTEDQKTVAIDQAGLPGEERTGDADSDMEDCLLDISKTSSGSNLRAPRIRDRATKDEGRGDLSPHRGSAGAEQRSSIVEQKQRKLELQMGVNRFNMKPKRGIEYLKQNGFVDDDPKAVAELFMNREIGLDKTSIGDYLGEDKPFNKGVLYALVDLQDFAGQELDESLRSFLSIFRLPGEAQKIDRMMEKFAEKYCTDNPNKYTNADCAFVLSFSLIMLQTDLHNPGIKNKMTKDEFVRNNRGINDNQDLPREHLEKLYEAVEKNPISLQEDREAQLAMDSQAAQGSAQKYELFVRETESIVGKCEEMMKQKNHKQKASVYVLAHSVEHVKPLFEVACWPYLATLAVLLEMQDSANALELCIEGFKHCIRIAARFDMDTERDAFVSSLAKFTYLTTVKEMKQKNIECIKALLAIGLSEGNNLGPSWQYVLFCISQLERLQLIGNRSRQDFQFFEEEIGIARGASNISTSGGQVVKRRAHGLGVSALVSLGQDDRQIEIVNSESIVSQIDAAQIELLFNKSPKLDSAAVVHFVTQLVRVSKEELALPDQPRIFSLQKLVEVADYNMNRIRLVWSRIWKVLSNHFIEVACHQNNRVCMFAIDSLRQLAMKFLEKDELSNYNFQADFLRPFEVVMVSTPGVTQEVKDLIVSIISNMVQGRIKNIKSGWKTVFHILHAAAQEHSSEAIVQRSFQIVQRVIEHHYNDVFVENFSDGIRTLLAFGQCKASLDMSLQSIKYLLQAAEYLADKTRPDPPPPPPPKLELSAAVPEAGPTGVAGSSHPAAHWFPILRGLSMLVSDPRRDVRAVAVNGMFDCLRDHGGNVFDEDTWRMVFNGVIKPLFDDIHHQLQHSDDRRLDGSADEGRSEGNAASWAAALGPPTCLMALTALVRLFEGHLDSLVFLLGDVLRLIENCIQHDTEPVARIGVEGLKQLLLHTGQSLRPDSWQKVTASILQLFRDSMPIKLMQTEDIMRAEAEAGQLPFRKDDVVIQCVVQLLLIDMLQDTVAQHFELIPPDGLMTLLDALQRSFEFAQEFNQQIELRQTLKRLGFMREMKQLPGLLKQEREALSCSLKVLFQVQSDERMQQSEYAAKAVERLMALCATVLQNYVAKEQILQSQADVPVEGTDEAAAVEMEREVHGLIPIISEVVLRGLKDLQPEQFTLYAHDLVPLLCELTTVNSREVRLMVREVLVGQVVPLVGAAMPGATLAPAVAVPLAEDTANGELPRD